MGAFRDPDELLEIMEKPDVLGRDCFWYFAKYELHKILNTAIMDKYMLRKWHGREAVNASILDYSASYNVATMDQKVDQIDQVSANLFSKKFLSRLIKMDKADLTHQFKFHIWKKSMFLRYYLEIFTLLIVTAVF